MARDTTRDSSEGSPALPNILLAIVLVLLLVWGIGGLYLPENPGAQGIAQPALSSETGLPKPVGNLVGAE